MQLKNESKPSEPYTVHIDERAITDIQSIVDYYDGQQSGLGERFYTSFRKSLTLLKANPFFMIRYDVVRCLPIRKFPFMIHYVIEDKAVIVYAVISTHLDNTKNQV